MSRSDADVTAFNRPGLESNWFYSTSGDTPPPSGFSGLFSALLLPHRPLDRARSLLMFELHAGEKLLEEFRQKNRQGSCFSNLK